MAGLLPKHRVNAGARGRLIERLALKPRTSMTRQQARRRSSRSGLGLSSPVPRSSNSRMADSCRLICSAATRPLSSATWHAP